MATPTTKRLQVENNRTEDAASPAPETPIGNSEEYENGNQGEEKDATKEIMRNQVCGNLLFLIGSVLYLWLALWGSTSWDGKNDGDSWGRTRSFISIMAPLSFVLNALVNLRRTLLDREVDYCWNITTDTAFGLAAVLELIPAVLFLVQENASNADRKWQTLIYRAAMLMYLVNAILAICQNWKRKEAANNDYSSMIHAKRDNLVQCGDWLFLVGSTIDITISYISTGQETTRFWNSVEVWCVLSATLWMVDAILYLLADWMEISVSISSHTVTHIGEVLCRDNCPAIRHSSPNQQNRQLLLEQLL